MNDPEHKETNPLPAGGASPHEYPVLPKKTSERVRGAVYTHPTKGHLVKCYGEKKQPRKIKTPKETLPPVGEKKQSGKIKTPKETLPTSIRSSTGHLVDYQAIAFEFVRQNGNHNMLDCGARREIDYLLNKFRRPPMAASEMSKFTFGDDYNARCGKLRGYDKETLLLLLSTGTNVKYDIKNIIPQDISGPQQSFGFGFAF